MPAFFLADKSTRMGRAASLVMAFSFWLSSSLFFPPWVRWQESCMAEKLKYQRATQMSYLARTISLILSLVMMLLQDPKVLFPWTLWLQLTP